MIPIQHRYDADLSTTSRCVCYSFPPDYATFFVVSHRLATSPLGAGTFFVMDSKTGCPSGHTATVHWGTRGQTPTMKCSCEGPQKMQMPCRHVLAAATGSSLGLELLPPNSPLSLCVVP